jgi:hypothetical protein
MDARARQTAGNLALLICAILGTLALLEAAVRLHLRFAPPSATLAAVDTDLGRRQRWRHYYRFQRERAGEDVAAFEASQHDPLLGWVPRPDLVDYVHPLLSSNRRPVGTNSTGMRGRREFSPDKPVAVRRIVIIGDSFTFGIGEDDDHVWPARLAADLDGWEVLNLGVFGYGTDQQLLMLRERGMRWQPDVVIQAVYVDDHFRNGMAFRDYAKPRFVLEGDTLRLTGVPVPTPDDVLAEADAPLGSRALAFIRARLRRGDSPRPADADLEPVTRAILHETVRTARAGGARLLLVVIPSQHARQRSRHVENLFSAWAAEFDVPVVNVREPLAARERDTGMPMWAVHFSRAGHEETARVVRRKLADLGWVPG